MASPNGAAQGPDPSSYLSVQERDGYWVVSMQKEPVNSLNLVMWQQLEAVLDRAEAAFPQVRGLILTTGLKRDVFTAGNDLLELYAPRTSARRYSEFWCTSNRVLCKLHLSRLSTMAAIRGACPAGGCMMALCCDHRVMSAAGAIGLNEVQLGILVPKFWALLMSQLIGRKAADKLLTTGKMVNPQEAKALGLVDQVVERDQVLGAAEKVMQQLIKLPPLAVAGTKRVLREDFCRQWEQYWAGEAEGAWGFLNEPETMRVLEAAMQRLSGGNKGGGAGAGAEGGLPSKL